MDKLSQSLASIDISSIEVQSMDNCLKINDLDDYSLQHIFKFLSFNEKLLVIEMVCKRWQRCVRALMAREIIRISFDETKPYKWCSSDSHFNYDKNRVLDFSKFPKFSNYSLSKILSRFPNIRCIKFSNELGLRFSIAFLIAITCFCDQLECIELDHNIIEFELKFCLDSDYINNYHFGYNPKDESMVIKNEIHENWMFFVNLIASKLLHLRISSEIDRQYIELLVENCTKLQELSIIGTNNYILEKISQNIQCIEVIKYDEDLNSYDLVKRLAVGNEQQITRLSLNMNLSVNTINLIGNKFSNLSKLSLCLSGNCSQRPFINLIEKLPNLKYICLNYLINYSKIYKKFSHKYLNDKYNCDNYLLSIFEKGSESIESIDFKNLIVSSETLSLIFERVSQIKNLILFDIKWENEKFWDFLLRMKNLRKLYVRKTFLPIDIFDRISTIETLELFDLEVLSFEMNELILTLISFRRVNKNFEIKVRFMAPQEYESLEEFKKFQTSMENNKINFIVSFGNCGHKDYPIDRIWFD